MTAGSAPDDPGTLRALDPSGMLSWVAGLGHQLVEGYRRGREAPGLPSGRGVRQVVVAGMGGSGMAGEVVRAVYGPALSVPLAVVRGYALPAWCGPHTLVATVSFSGSTEETLAAFEAAVGAGCRVVAVSAGGRLAELARSAGAAHVPVSAAVPVPRAALGEQAGILIGALESAGILPPQREEVAEAVGVLDRLAGELGPDRPRSRNRAKDLAAWLLGGTPVVWGSEGLAEAAALRWKTQLNENAKVPAWWSVLPELDHNEVEGWAPGWGEGVRLVVLRHRAEHPRVARRVAASLEAVAGSGLSAREVWAEEAGPLGALLSLVMVGDFASTYLALMRGVDPTPIPVLSGLKGRLAT